MATVADARANMRTGFLLAAAVVLGLIAVVAVNFSNNPPSTDPTYSAPTLPHQP